MTPEQALILGVIAMAIVQVFKIVLSACSGCPSPRRWWWC